MWRGRVSTDSSYTRTLNEADTLATELNVRDLHAEDSWQAIAIPNFSSGDIIDPNCRRESRREMPKVKMVRDTTNY
jgi:hypothetical protein